MITDQTFSCRRRRGSSIATTPPASSSDHQRLALVALARKALFDVPELPIMEMIASGTLSENIAALAASRPSVADPARWRGLVDALKSMGMAGLEAMENMPLVLLDLLDDMVADARIVNGSPESAANG